MDRASVVFAWPMLLFAAPVSPIGYSMSGFATQSIEGGAASNLESGLVARTRFRRHILFWRQRTNTA